MLHYWLVITSAWFIFTFIISYTLSVSNEHVYYLFPFISDTGTVPPESCIFGQMLNIAAVLLAVCMYIRYRQVKFILNSNEINLQRSWNEIAFWLGNISCLGISVVANFQETNLLAVHLFGALMAFGIGGIYLIVQTRISFSLRHINYKDPRYGVGRHTLILRTLLTFLFFTSLFTMMIIFPIARSKFTGNNILWWTEEQGGYHQRLAATFSEWIMVTCFILYTLTAVKEFKSLEFKEILFRSKLTNDVQEMS